MTTDQKNKLLFILLFFIVGFITLQIPFSHLLGSNVSFSLFDFFGPIAGAFLSPLLGVVTVLIVELANFFIKHTSVTTGAIIRLFPTLFATYYFAQFSKKKEENRLILLVPLIAIIAFTLHPIGRSVWYYSMFWLIPLLSYFRRTNLYVRSLGATFTAHAVGGVAWIWAFNLQATVWKSLIPVVIQERLLFAAGISLSYLAIKYILEFLMNKKLLPKISFASLI